MKVQIKNLTLKSALMVQKLFEVQAKKSVSTVATNKLVDECD